MKQLQPCSSPYCRDGPTDEELSASFGPPPNKWEIGSVSWLCMHTAAASIDDQDDPCGTRFLAWLRACLQVYPCTECKSDFDRILAELPIPSAGSKEILSLWVCEFHNRVNKSLGAPIFACDAQQLLKQFAL
eukprot:Blabericola_migrator_1__355@NODE_108_length_14046_cov_203_246656_g96_i0_p7_GENE_NODE_108_length_14046_cov_203_246656_g96_i0NODE_108_length_14046_cov_203_246656_g96_i0_p7_ORF_typecomplete_len132_score16_20Evr1_Alr/PF04777_13/4_6e16BPS1/PF05633_11/0_022_NODE_108_length_14046_cov_203_246656_g96_i06811076